MKTPAHSAYISNEILLVASGDLRETANRECWPAQAEMEAKISAAFASEGYTISRAHPYDPQLGHGFIRSQRMGMDVFRNIDRDAPLIVAEAVWQYSYHLLAGLRDHRGPILTLANWSGQWPGLVGMLNLNGCLTKMGVAYSTLWSRDFSDAYFINGLRQWLREGKIDHDASHVRDFELSEASSPEVQMGKTWPRSCAAIKPSWASSMKAAWGCTTPSLKISLSTPWASTKSA